MFFLYSKNIIFAAHYKKRNKLNIKMLKTIAKMVVLAALVSACSTNSVKVKKADMKLAVDSASYMVGYSYGSGIYGDKDQYPGDPLNLDALVNGFLDGIKGGESGLKVEDVRAYLNEYFSNASMSKGVSFLKENAQKEGVVTTESGLQYEIIKQGDGPKPSISDRVKVHYHGTLVDGTVFDSSKERGEPIEFNVGGVIEGWQEGLQLMNVGSIYKLYVPSELGYGSQPAGSIPPNSVLIFEVELLEITNDIQE